LSNKSISHVVADAIKINRPSADYKSRFKGPSSN
jgi:hypothetical protein